MNPFQTELRHILKSVTASGGTIMNVNSSPEPGCQANVDVCGIHHWVMHQGTVCWPVE